MTNNTHQEPLFPARGDRLVFGEYNQVSAKAYLGQTVYATDATEGEGCLSEKSIFCSCVWGGTPKERGRYAEEIVTPIESWEIGAEK